LSLANAAAATLKTDDLLGLDNRLLCFLFLDAGSGGASFLNELVRLSGGLIENLLPGSLSLGQLRLDFVGVGNGFGNALLALLQHRQDRLVREPLEEEQDDREVDRLGRELEPVNSQITKGFSYSIHNTTGLGAGNDEEGQNGQTFGECHADDAD